mgnify:CR=1 FL=1
MHLFCRCLGGEQFPGGQCRQGTSGQQHCGECDLSDGTIMPDRTYAVAAIGTSDGTPMPEFPDTDFFVSPLIQGYNPAFYNAASMGGSCPCPL